MLNNTELNSLFLSIAAVVLLSLITLLATYHKYYLRRLKAFFASRSGSEELIDDPFEVLTELSDLYGILKKDLKQDKTDLKMINSRILMKVHKSGKYKEFIESQRVFLIKRIDESEKEIKRIESIINNMPLIC